MADPVTQAITAKVDEMAASMPASWLSPTNWIETSDGLIDLIAGVGDKLDPLQFATLFAAAAMAKREAADAAVRAKQ